MNEPNYEKFWKEAKEELAYWKEKYEAMKQRCEAAEKILVKYSHRIPDSPEFMDWESLKQKQ